MRARVVPSSGRPGLPSTDVTIGGGDAATGTPPPVGSALRCTVARARRSSWWHEQSGPDEDPQRRSTRAGARVSTAGARTTSDDAGGRATRSAADALIGPALGE